MAVNEVHAALENEAITLGLNIITENTKAIVQDWKQMIITAIHLNNIVIATVDGCTYLGSIINTNNDKIMKIKGKAKANTAYFLMINLFKSRTIHSENKTKIYTPTVYPMTASVV